MKVTIKTAVDCAICEERVTPFCAMGKVVMKNEEAEAQA
jgi:hypothetical protein